jgi:hypothetical protein
MGARTALLPLRRERNSVVKSRRLETAIVVCSALILLLLSYERQAAQQRGPASLFSTYDSGPNGYRALLTVLRQAGVDVSQFDRRLAVLAPETKTLVLSGYENDPSPNPLNQRDVETLRRFVAGGGRLVVLDSKFAGNKDATPGIGSSVAATQNDATALVDNRFTSGVARVAAPIEAVFPFSEREGVPLLANASGVVAVAYAFGKGEVVAVTAPALFGNAYLRRAGNLAFAYDVVSGHGPAAFDEYVHGYDDDLSFWAALPQSVHVASFVVAAIVLLAIVGASVPFAPPVPLEPPDERDSSAFVDAMAALMRRAQARRAAVAAFAQNARRLYRRSEDERVREFAAEIERLAGAAAVSDQSLLRAAELDYRLRRAPS